MLQRTFVKSKGAYKVKFTLKPANAETVEILGLYGDWDTPIALSKKKDGSFSVEVTLPKDMKHEFKYRVNESEWLIEEDADAQEPNEFGSENSVLVL